MFVFFERGYSSWTSGRYDFDPETGKSETGRTACPYSVEIRNDPEDRLENMFMEPLAGGSNRHTVELRPVSKGISYYSIYYRIRRSSAIRTKEKCSSFYKCPRSKVSCPWSSTYDTYAIDCFTVILNTPNPILNARTRHFLTKSARVSTNNITGWLVMQYIYSARER